MNHEQDKNQSDKVAEVDRIVIRLLERLAVEGGKIVCTAALSVEDIDKARKDDRMVVLENGIGFVFAPPISVDEQLRVIANAPISNEFVRLRKERDESRAVCRMLVKFDEMSDDEQEYFRNDGAMIDDIIEEARKVVEVV